jgi:osmotically-inducible protein OsmY
METGMRSDSDIKRDVEAELRWSPDVDETDIAVKVNDGEVTLSGFAHNYLEKYRAEIATRRIKGVTAVANDIHVKALAGAPTDPEIARAAVEALKMDLPLTWEQIAPIVKEGHISLEGAVEWHYQRERAESVIRRVKGVVSVRNSIKIRPSLAPEDIRHRIEDAFGESRRWMLVGSWWIRWVRKSLCGAKFDPGQSVTRLSRLRGRPPASLMSGMS